MGRARRFTSRREIELAFPTQLDPDCDLPLDQFKDLVGDYMLPKQEWVRCQLVDEHGRCNEEHGHGWLAERMDRTVVFMGHNCAELRFGSDPRFAALFAEVAARAGRDIEKNALIRRLSKLLSDPTVGPTVDAASRKRALLDDRVNQIRRLLRPETLRRLMERIKRGNMAVRIRVMYVETEIDEKTKKERKVVTPRELGWGILAGVESLNTGPLNRIGGKLSEARAALNQAVASEDHADKTMKTWATALESVLPAARELEGIEAALARFLNPKNLQLLWLLEKDALSQIASVNVALELTSRQRVTDEQAISTHQAWVQEIRDAHQGFRFEVVG